MPLAARPTRMTVTMAAAATMAISSIRAAGVGPE